MQKGGREGYITVTQRRTEAYVTHAVSISRPGTQDGCLATAVLPSLPSGTCFL